MRTWAVLILVFLSPPLLRPNLARAQDDDFGCRRAIQQGYVKYLKKVTGTVLKCNDQAVKAGQDAPGGDIVGCDVDQKIEDALGKLRAKVFDKCQEAGISPGDVSWPASCPDFESGACGAAIGDSDQLVDCLNCVGRAAVGREMDGYYVSLTDPAGDGNLLKCQRSIGRTTAKFSTAMQKIADKCRRDVDKGKGTLPCPVPGNGKAEAAIAKARAKHVAKICKACGSESLDGVVCEVGGFAPSQIGFASECPEVTVPFGGSACGGPITDLNDLVACVACVAEFDVSCMDALSRPDQVGFPAECVAPAPTPPPSATPTATLSSTPTDTATFTPTSTEIDTASPTDTPTSTATATPSATPSSTATSSTASVFFRADESTAYRGGVGGGDNDDSCPAGQALVGFSGNLKSLAESWHREIRGICGTVQRTGAPGTFTVGISAGATLPTRGGGAGAGTVPWTRTCPANHVVTGFSGRKGLYLDELVLTCRPLLVDANDGMTFSLGTATTLPAIGTAVNPLFAQTDCPSGKVASMARTRSGDEVDALALGCGSPALIAPTPLPTPCTNFLGKWGTAGSGAGQFGNPNFVAVDAAGNVYVSEVTNNRVQKFDSTGAFLTQWGTTGSGDGQFNVPRGIAVDSSSNVYVADSGNRRIQKFTSSGAFVAKWGSAGTGDGQFLALRGLAIDTSNNVYVVDNGNDRIQKFDPTGTFLAKWGTSGTGDSQFIDAIGIAVDSAGNVYVADGGTGTDRVQRFTSTGVFLSNWGAVGTSPGRLSNPFGVAVDANGYVYVADSGNQRVSVFAGGLPLVQWGTSGSGDGQFMLPSGVAVDAAGKVFVSETNNNRVQKFGCP